jgi:hypothetical protein
LIPTRYVVSLVVICVLAGCAGRKPADAPAAAGADQIGVYKARLEQADGRSRRFRLFLFAELPDRLHAEVVSPVGTTLLVVDAGDGRISVARVRDRLAYVGRANPDVIEGLLGVRLSLADFVSTLLIGEPRARGYRVIRVAPAGVVLPDRLEIIAPETSLRLQLKRRRSLDSGTGELGRGRPPDGMELRDLTELDLGGMPELRDEDG